MTGVDADLATLRETLNAFGVVSHNLQANRDATRIQASLAALSRVEAELSRLREDLDALNRERDAGWRTMVEQRDRAEAAEARLGEAHQECARLQQAIAPLVTLVRIGFLVTVNGERAGTEVVNDSSTRELLFAILQAKDTAAAVEALAGLDTPAIPPRPPIQPPGHQREMADTPADSPVARTEHKQKGLLTPAQRDELERFVDGQPHQLTGSAASGPARNLVRRNLLTRAPIMAGFYRITEYGRALLGEDTPAASQEDKT